MNLLPQEDSVLYAQAFGSFALNSPNLICNHLDHRTKDEVDELLMKITELESNIVGLKSEVSVQMMELEKMKCEMDESQVFYYFVVFVGRRNLVELMTIFCTLKKMFRKTVRIVC